jgi:hypothetical protein
MELFPGARLKPVVEKVSTVAFRPAQKHAIKRAVERKGVKTYFDRATKYDAMNLGYAREILNAPEQWAPFYVAYARCVVERLDKGRVNSGPSGWTA